MIELLSKHLPDHSVAGRAVVPAVDIVAALAKEVCGRCDVRVMGEARMVRFLGADELERCELMVGYDEAPPSPPAPLPAGVGHQLEACAPQGVRETPAPGRAIRAILSSRILAGTVSRSRLHASVVFGLPSPVPALPSLPEPECTLDAARVYAELVPFGPWFHNLRGQLELGPDGASAAMTTPPGAIPNELLGSPFLLDAAMHLACVWGQRYAGYVAIPTGYASRTVARPLASGPARCVVAPRQVGASELCMDVWVLDVEGRVCDAVQGLTMAHQRAMPAPPAWIRR